MTTAGVWFAMLAVCVEMSRVRSDVVGPEDPLKMDSQI
jgi:hypothetical protein